MAEIAPFRGILYDTSKSDASSVMAPPYDVIDEDMRAALIAKDPHNCTKLILPQGEGDQKYANAKSILDEWFASGVLVRDERPALYRYHQVFRSSELGGREVVRRGFIAHVRLHAFDEGVILRHELTLAGPKVDRLKLMEATGCHFSQIFTLYSDPAGETDRAFAAAERTAPCLDGTTEDGTRHLLWRVTDSEVIGTVKQQLASSNLYIADGHHRYETMLALRKQLRDAAGGSLDSDSRGEFGTMFLANMDDPGLVVLPTHRLVHGVAAFDAEHLRGQIGEFFEVATHAGIADDADECRRLLTVAGKRRPSLAMATSESNDVDILTLRGDFDPAASGLELPVVLRQLDVTLLHGVIIESMLGIDKAAQEAKTNLRYYKDTELALAERGRGQVLFLMNATPVDQVRAVSDAGEVMPQKSTFFYPKIASGVVFGRIDPTETT